MKKSMSNSNRIVITQEDYSKLFFTHKNRPIKKSHINKMRESVLKHGCLRLVVVVWDEVLEKFIVADGQHLTKALMSLNRPIECHVVECETQNELTQLMIDLNNTSQSWKAIDYLHSWSESGIKDYSFIRSVVETNSLQLSVILMAYAQKKRFTTMKSMQDGTYKISDKKLGNKLLDQVRDCNNFIPSTRAINDALVQLMVSVENYNHKQMVKKLKNLNGSLVLETNENKLYQQLVDIYSGKAN